MRKRWIAMIVLTASLAGAQDATFTDTANQPNQGVFYVRLSGMQEWGSESPGDRDFQRQRMLLRTQYGISHAISLMADTALDSYRPDGADSVNGLADSRLGLKLALMNFGGLAHGYGQLAAMAGLILPGSDRELGRFDNDPGAYLGVLVSAHRERQAINGSLVWLAADHNSNTVELNLSYLFRLAPEILRIHTRSAWYGQFELLTTTEEGGVHRVHLAPGLLYETPTWALEGALRLPVYERNSREELDAAVVLGVRKLF